MTGQRLDNRDNNRMYAAVAILVVDDDRASAKPAYLFRRDGHQVETAANGHLLLYTQERGDLILRPVPDSTARIVRALS
jgi:hypothetical protein